MQIVTRCPLRAASILWLPRPHAYALTVVCKATFELAPGVSRLASEQEAPFENDVYLDDDEGRSLDAASDLVPFKRSPEVLVVGHAHAPDGRPVASLVARLTIAEIDKAIAVTGDRFVLPDGSISVPARFRTMPLRWERAAGGADTSNPVGLPMGGEAYPDLHGRIRLPNLAPQGHEIREPHDVVDPVGFGPIAPRWPARASKLHRHAATFQPDAWHVRPLPADVERAYFNAAPADQALHELAGTERLILENLHPQHALLRTRLAPIAPRATVDFGDGATQDLPLACDTLLIDADRGLATLTFRGTLALDVPERAGWIVLTLDDADDLEEIATDPSIHAGASEDLDAETYAGHVDPSGVVLPFLSREAPRAAPTFGAPPLVAPAEVAPAPVHRTIGELVAPAVPAPAPVHRTIGEIVAEQRGQLPTPLPPPMVTEPALDIPSSGDVAEPPPLVGPIALPEEPLFGDGAPPSADGDDATSLPPPPPEEPAPPAPRELPLDAFPLELCARIAARIARRKADRAAILDAERLPDDEWERLAAHWAEVIREGTSRGKTATLDAWDEAYVDELEVERGVIAVEEYASLVIASERNTAEARLVELGLPRGALIRIRRVWSRKMRADATLAALVRSAVEAAAA